MSEEINSIVASYTIPDDVVESIIASAYGDSVSDSNNREDYD